MLASEGSNLAPGSPFPPRNSDGGGGPGAGVGEGGVKEISRVSGGVGLGGGVGIGSVGGDGLGKGSGSRSSSGRGSPVVPRVIYEKFPADIKDRYVLLLDPILATGVSSMVQPEPQSQTPNAKP